MKGHQDLKHPHTTQEAHLNHKADRLANLAHTEGERHGYQPPGYKITLYIQGNPITANYTGEIQRAATTPEIRKYYITKHHWTDAIMDTIDWDAFGGAQTKFTIGQQRTLHKYVHGWLPTGNHMEYRYGIKSQCPFCKAAEDNHHVLDCRTQQHFQQAFELKLTKLLKTWNTESGLTRLLIQHLQGNHTPYRGSKTDIHWVEQLLQEQKKIGKTQLWRGFLSQTWGDLQEKFYRRQKCQKEQTGTQWSRRVIKEIWTHALEMWTRQNKKLHDDGEQSPPH